MFIPLSAENRESLQERGKLVIRPDGKDAQFSDKQVACVVSYMNVNSGKLFPMFKCVKVETLKTLLLSGVRLKKNMRLLNEAHLHFFIGWFIDTAEIWALSALKNRVFISTNVSHATEYFLEKDYSFRKNNQTWSARKDLIKECDGNSKN